MMITNVVGLTHRNYITSELESRITLQVLWLSQDNKAQRC